MMRWFVCVICVAASLHGFGQGSQDTRRMIFPEQTPVLFDLLPDSTLQRFTPSAAEIDSADRYLMIRLTRDTAADRNPPALNLYYRQYAGFLRGGTKYLFINAACRKPDYFTKNTFYPKGGGICYFRALVDLNTNNIITLLYNAPL